MEYLKKVAGMRTVPIEVGKTYLEETWSQKLMTLSDFIDLHVGPSSSPNLSDSSGPSSGPNLSGSPGPSHIPTGYLAQTQLFDQIPELRKDIIINPLSLGSFSPILLAPPLAPSPSHSSTPRL